MSRTDFRMTVTIPDGEVDHTWSTDLYDCLGMQDAAVRAAKIVEAKYGKGGQDSSVRLGGVQLKVEELDHGGNPR